MSRQSPLRILLVDNYDSYTYNLYQLLGEVGGVPPVVVRNDAIGPAERVDREFTHVVLSPGPGHPRQRRSTGGCAELILGTRLPLLGVCLGHQAIATCFGGTVTAVEPRHGQASAVEHDGTGVLHGIPQGLRVIRYHSLAVTAVPESLEVTGRTRDGTVMALRHRVRPLHGVQFHPESIGTEHGRRLVENFLAMRPAPSAVCRATPAVSSAPPAPVGCAPTSPVVCGPTSPAVCVPPAPVGCAPPAPAPRAAERQAQPARARLLVREAPWRDPEDVFVAHYAHQPHVCWLDSADARPGQGRVSYLAAPEPGSGHVATYRTGEPGVRLLPGAGHPATVVPGHIFDILRERLGSVTVRPDGEPFGFRGGYLGYLGYEVTEPCGGRRRHRARTPDAAFLYVERFLAFDHDARRVYAAAVVRSGEEREAGEWLRGAVERVRATGTAPAPATGGRLGAVASTMDDDGYAEAYRAVQRHLALGDTYEVNLTYRLGFTCTAPHADLYRHLRRTNPAPYAAFLRVPGACVLCSSPERFLRIGPHGTIEARPIKGTSARARDASADQALRRSLGRDPKTYAENLMIVDLLRNDLGQVCRPGSVRVPQLMAVESYPTVHQLVSTVTGVLAPGVDAVTAVRAAFPAGSMTGAPKLRTMEIIDAVERDARGVYSGALGYFSLCGRADLNVVIRSIVARGTDMSIGIGGGVVHLSTMDEERAEAELKAAALLAAVRNACAGQPPEPGRAVGVTPSEPGRAAGVAHSGPAGRGDVIPVATR